MDYKQNVYRVLLICLLVCGGFALPAAAQIELQGLCTVPTGLGSNLTIDSAKICLDANPSDGTSGKTVRLVGYSGDFAEVNRDQGWSSTACRSGCNPDANPPTCTSDKVADSLATIQVNLTTPKTGANFERIIATGGACNGGFSTSGTCTGYNGKAEIMPFERLTSGTKVGKFNVTFSTSGGTGALDKCWEARFRSYLQEAQKNGMIVMIDLFSENTMSGATAWDRNPWKPKNNNMNCTDGSTTALTGSSGLPGFYIVCTGQANKTKCTELNCLGQIQKTYVDMIVQAVKDSGVRNVIFEVMNEARLASNADNIDEAEFAVWHNTVASWAPRFIWSANIKKGATHPDNFGLLNSCLSATNCDDPDGHAADPNISLQGNPYLVFWQLILTWCISALGLGMVMFAAPPLLLSGSVGQRFLMMTEEVMLRTITPTFKVGPARPVNDRMARFIFITLKTQACSAPHPQAVQPAKKMIADCLTARLSMRLQVPAGPVIEGLQIFAEKLLPE